MLVNTPEVTQDGSSVSTDKWSKDFFPNGAGRVCVCVFTKKGGGAHTIIYPKMVNVYAIVNRDIFGVPTHLPSPTHVSVPNVVIETR